MPDDDDRPDRVDFWRRAIALSEYLLTQDMHGTRLGPPVDEGEWHGVAVWSVVYRLDHGQYKIWVAPNEGTWALANDAPGRLNLVYAPAFGYPEDFACWVRGQLLISAELTPPRVRLLLDDQGQRSSA